MEENRGVVEGAGAEGSGSDGRSTVDSSLGASEDRAVLTREEGAYLTQCIYHLFSESQIPPKNINSIF